MKLKKKFLEKSKKVAEERINILMNLAEKESNSGKTERSKNYVLLGKKIAMRMRMPYPKEWKRRICKNCGSFLIYGKNARVRTKAKNYPHVVITCLECNSITRIPIKTAKK
ncbi:ribonuclease P protein component 4 [Methanococcus maripaludis]|jgi:ribonuclease P protein subunit RPR2|uniref:Ribonuclease P protein component 4 n=2 Tax=Methanococcus maripaludis TaxID=39152 RepID=RNP4_METMP|nr:ribonuclease P protein component 4 [Methanococcus maripaludis]P62378.1 RecName: Full=Ribonuclease P protein component 4; Short=RNase P component 4; AltName: Full=Rpp21 [Methanococcus maripaludis S2]MDK2928741.1 ribonuclease protein subunit [Methanococcus sp.]MBA2850678.1 ribonuclease P protein subunit RPR2 [Methanococcus maripaludis]MBA2852909.1 ribonuclease P protein subunit RPR2 [Methanococcus maripaludis]MBA2858113.1 ribonuclease P protein subunit RPR2 [Methanococcus maripaludis]MBA2868